MRQHRMTKQMPIGLAADRDRQFAGMGPVQLDRPARFPVPRKEHLQVRPVQQTPLRDPALKRAQMFQRYLLWRVDVGAISRDCLQTRESGKIALRDSIWAF